MIQQQDQSDPIKCEVHMYHATAMANAVTPTSWFYTLYVHTPSSIVQRDNPSRLEIAFLLDSDASISVLNYPTYITLTKLLDIRSNHTSDVGPPRTSKTLTVANQTEVPILHYANIILNTTIDEKSRYFSVPFAVADIKYNILGTPFFEDNIQNINIQDFTLEFKYQSKIHPNYAKFTTLLSKDHPYFSYIYRINSMTQIRLKPKSSKIAHLPIQNYQNLHFTTTPQNHFFPSVPHTYFATKLRTNFNFIEVFTDDKPDICATIIQNTSKHVATLPTGHIGYIEVPITNEKPKFFQVNDITPLIHNVTYTYYPEITEPLPQTNYIVQYDDPTTPPPQFSLHQIYMTNDDIPNQTSPLYNVQPTSHTSEKRMFPSLPYTSENLKFNNKFNFQFSDLTEFSEKTVQNTRSFTITDDSNLIIIPTHNITQNEFNIQNHDNTLTTNPDNTSVLSTSNTNITQPSQTQVPSPRNYNPPPVPPQFSTQINTHNSPQQSSSNTHHITQNTNTVHFQTPTPPSPAEIQTSTFTPAQTNPVPTTQPTLNINTIHSNPSFNYTTARHLSRPPLHTLLNNPLSYGLTSTNPSHTQQS